MGKTEQKKSQLSDSLFEPKVANQHEAAQNKCDFYFEKQSKALLRQLKTEGTVAL